MKAAQFMKKRFWIAGFAFVLFLVLAVRMTIAWLVAPGQAAADGVEMAGVDMPFYVRVAEQEDTSYFEGYKSLIQKADAELSEGVAESVTVGEETTDYYKTGAEADSLIWRLESTETAANGGIITTGMHPGSAGVLRFEIVPTQNGDLAMDAVLNIRAFTADYPTEEEILAGADGSVPKALNEVEADGGDSGAAEALGYINGHILFFEEENEGIYSGFIGEDAYHKEVTNAVKGTAIPVSLHWVWVNTVDQILLKSGDGGTDVPVVGDDQDTDRTKLIGYVKSNVSRLFRDVTAYDTEDYNLGNKIAELTYATYKADSDTRTNLNSCYNAADQLTGVKLQYLLLEMTVTEGEVLGE